MLLKYVGIYKKIFIFIFIKISVNLYTEYEYKSYLISIEYYLFIINYNIIYIMYSNKQQFLFTYPCTMCKNSSDRQGKYKH